VRGTGKLPRSLYWRIHAYKSSQSAPADDPCGAGRETLPTRCSTRTSTRTHRRGADIIVGMFNSESLTVLDALEANAERLSGLRIHQMFPSRERDYMHGAFTGLRHVSWFLSSANREAFRNDTCDLIPNNFSDVPALMRRATRRYLAPCCRRSSGSPRLLLAWHQRRLCGGADR
jgi:hypothetical protein